MKPLESQESTWELIVRIPADGCQGVRSKKSNDKCYLVGVVAPTMEEACRHVVHTKMESGDGVKSITVVNRIN